MFLTMHQLIVILKLCIVHCHKFYLDISDLIWKYFVL